MPLTQSHFRFGVVELAESTHGWHFPEDVGGYRVPGANGQFLLRFCVQANGTGLNNVDFEFQRRLLRNGVEVVAWGNVNNTNSTVVRTGANAVFTNGQDCTKRLGGTGTFVTNNDGCTHDGTTGGGNNDIPANGCSECEVGLQVIDADVQWGDVIEFRLTRDGGVLLDAYAVTPRVVVASEIFPVATRNPGVLGPAERSVPAGVAGRSFLVKTAVPQSDLDDPAVAFDLRLYRRNADTSWPTPDWGVHDEFAGCTFVGGPNQGKGGTPTVAPGFFISGDEVAGSDVRLYMNNTGVAFDGGLVAVPQ